MRFSLSIGIACLLAGFAVCSSWCAAQADAGLGESTWVLTGYVGSDGDSRAVLDGTRIDAMFAGGQVSGSAGCNTYSSTYVASGSSLTFDAVAVTEMWCQSPEGVMEQELEFLALLADVEYYTAEDGILTLSDDEEKSIAVFSAEE